MQRKPWEQAVKTSLAVVALMATVLALYVQIFEVRSRQEEARLAALRLDEALAGSRSRLKAEILAELRAELAAKPEAEAGTQPRSGTVLRRTESHGLEAFGPTSTGQPLTLAQLAGMMEALSLQMEESDRTLRRDLEELRAASRAELDAASNATSLALVALISLVAHLLYSYWRERVGEP